MYSTGTSEQGKREKQVASAGGEKKKGKEGKKNTNIMRKRKD